MHDDNEYCIWGFHFFNQENHMKEIDEEFAKLVGKEKSDEKFGTDEILKTTVRMVEESTTTYGTDEEEYK